VHSNTFGSLDISPEITEGETVTRFETLLSGWQHAPDQVVDARLDDDGQHLRTAEAEGPASSRD